jgi:hypothetical protein
MIFRRSSFVMLFIMFLYMSSSLAQHRGQLIAPQIPFPENITGKLKGLIRINYSVDGYGEIKSYALRDIVLIQENNEEKYIYSNKSLLLHYPSKNTKLGNSLAKKLHPFVKEFGSKTRFESYELPDASYKSHANSIGECSLDVYFGYTEAENKAREEARQKTIQFFKDQPRK